MLELRSAVIRDHQRAAIHRSIQLICNTHTCTSTDSMALPSQLSRLACMHVFLDSLSLLYSGGYFRGFGSRAFASVPSECLRFPTHLGCTIRRPRPGEVAPFLVNVLKNHKNVCILLKIIKIIIIIIELDWDMDNPSKIFSAREIYLGA